MSGRVTSACRDEPVRVYLRHRAQIEEWAALAGEAKRIAHQAMTTVGDRLAESPPGGAEALAGDDGNYDARLLYRLDWLGDDGQPIAAVGLGWSPSSVDFKPGSSWVGIWRGQRDHPDPLVDALRSSLAGTAAGLGLKSKGWAQWPLYGSAPGPRGEFWDNLRPWLDEVEGLVRSVWERLADEVEATLEAMRRGDV